MARQIPYALEQGNQPEEQGDKSAEQGSKSVEQGNLDPPDEEPLPVA